MRVVIATPLYPPEPGGPATYASILIELLVREGVEAVLVKFSDVRHLPKVIRHVAYAWRVFVSAKKANVVLVLDPVSTGLPALLGATCAGKPFVVKVVGDYAWEQGRQRYGITSTLDDFVNTRRVPFQVRFLRFIQTFVARQARMVIVPSEYLKTVVLSWGIFHGKIAVIHNAIRHEEAGEIPHEVSTLPYPHIVSVGRLVPWKHVDGVIDAVAKLPAASLIIVGDGPERVSLVAHAGTVGSRVTFTGALSHADTLAVIADAQVFVLNSSYEGFSHLLVEAVSLGVPVVATDVGGNKEIVQKEEDGILVPAGDRTALVRGIERALSRKKRTRPEDAIVRFSPKTMVRKTAELIKSLM
jgi:glycosyltransferase involved in cell wall biosynthesis